MSTEELRGELSRLLGTNGADVGAGAEKRSAPAAAPKGKKELAKPKKRR
jgi:hypothetical protein